MREAPAHKISPLTIVFPTEKLPQAWRPVGY